MKCGAEEFAGSGDGLSEDEQRGVKAAVRLGAGVKRCEGSRCERTREVLSSLSAADQIAETGHPPPPGVYPPDDPRDETPGGGLTHLPVILPRCFPNVLRGTPLPNVFWTGRVFVNEGGQTRTN